MNLAISILLIVIGAVLLFACVISPKNLSGRGGGLFVDMQELFQGQSRHWRVVGLTLGVILIVAGGVGPYIPVPTANEPPSTTPIPTSSSPTPTDIPSASQEMPAPTSVPPPAATSVPTATPVPADSVAISPRPESIEVGSELQLVAVVRDKDGTVLPGRTVTWRSTAPQFADVGTNTGTVTSRDAGTAGIIATSEGTSDVVVINVVPVPVADIALSPESLTLVEGEEATVTAKLLDKEGNELTERQVTWTSSANEIAKVVSVSPLKGLITGTKAAPDNEASFVSITAMAEDESASLPILVKHGRVSSVHISWHSSSPFSVALAPCFEQKGDTGQLEATLRDQKGHALTGSVTWSSNRSDIVSVDENGRAKREGSGTAAVTARADNGVRGTINITVPSPRCILSIG